MPRQLAERLHINARARGVQCCTAWRVRPRTHQRAAGPHAPQIDVHVGGCGKAVGDASSDHGRPRDRLGALRAADACARACGTTRTFSTETVKHVSVCVHVRVCMPRAAAPPRPAAHTLASCSLVVVTILPVAASKTNTRRSLHARSTRTHARMQDRTAGSACMPRVHTRFER
jgi:hypothetical protein